MAAVQDIPEGFEPAPTGLGFTDVLQPFFRRVMGEEVSFGFRVDQQHLNMMGICHGGVLMTLADIAAAAGISRARGQFAGTPTINLSLDFMSPGKPGDWVQADIGEVTIKRRFGFSSGLIVNERGIVARFNGTFYLPEHEGGLAGGEEVLWCAGVSLRADLRDSAQGGW
ncbi:MAG: PaaI family thioesterase [Parahaliea sp.]